MTLPASARLVVDDHRVDPGAQRPQAQGLIKRVELLVNARRCVTASFKKGLGIFAIIDRSRIGAIPADPAL
ncbi:MAG: hypothetical protein ACLPZR_11670 [Solirubrobacteraceae bacterium]